MHMQLPFSPLEARVLFCVWPCSIRARACRTAQSVQGKREFFGLDWAQLLPVWQLRSSMAATLPCFCAMCASWRGGLRGGAAALAADALRLLLEPVDLRLQRQLLGVELRLALLGGQLDLRQRAQKSDRVYHALLGCPKKKEHRPHALAAGDACVASKLWACME